MNEFELIERHFARTLAAREDLTLGIGDDAALLAPPVGMLVASTQVTLTDATDHPARLANRLVERAMARMACRAATPRWATLALTLPAVDQDWLAGFADALAACLAAHAVALVGGDTTRGPCTATLAVHGSCEPPACEPPLPAAGDRLLLADVDATQALLLGRQLAGRIVMRACDADLAEAARMFAAGWRLQATLEQSLPVPASEAALLLALAADNEVAATTASALVPVGRLA